MLLDGRRLGFSTWIGLRELPALDRHRQANVPGMYVIGDLADAPIVKAALRQGWETGQHVADLVVGSRGVGASRRGTPPVGADAAAGFTAAPAPVAVDVDVDVDVVIVGGGPAGVLAAMALQERGVSYVVIEQAEAFRTIAAFPRGKVIYADPPGMEAPPALPFDDAPKEDLVARWRDEVARRSLTVHPNEEVLGVDGRDGAFVVRTRAGPGGPAGSRPPPPDPARSADAGWAAEADKPATDAGDPPNGAGHGGPAGSRPPPPDPARSADAGWAAEADKPATDAGDPPNGAAENAYRCRKVVVAVGRRGTPRRLGVPGDERALVSLVDPADHASERVVVVGGGDTAVETACAIADAGGRVVLVHRGARIDRAKAKNRDWLDRTVAGGRVVLRLGAEVARVEQADVVLADGERLPCDRVFAMLGTDLPLGLLERLGLRLRSDVREEVARLPWVLGFVALVWAFYCLKQGRSLFPFGWGPLAGLHEALTVAAPWLPTVDGSIRTLGPGFWGTLLYTAAIAGFGLAAMRRHPTSFQRRRYASLIGFQVVFLFGIPELVAPMLTATPAKAYALSVPWPLSIWSLAHEPAAWGWLLLGLVTAFVLVPLYVWRNNESFCSWMCGCGGLAETVGDLWRWRAPRGDLARKAERGGLVVLLCAIPVTLLVLNDLWELVGFRTWLDQEVVVTEGARGPDVELEGALGPVTEGRMRVSNAWIEGDALRIDVEKLDWDGAWHPTGWIGAVASGDRVLTPEKLAEGRYTLPLAAIGEGGARLRVTAASSSLSGASTFAKGWYDLVVDFWLASIVGVALYPLLGNRMWCRFFCPLRAWMELLSKRFGRLAIAANDKCISCGECTRYCQMGIDVQGFAEQQLHFDNVNSACIQCGICVEVCPMDTLSLVDKRVVGLPDGRTDVVGPRWG